MTFEQVAARAIDYAEQGFPLRPLTARAIEENIDFLKEWPENRRYWLKPDGAPYAAGETIALPALAGTLRKMVEAEQAHAHLGRAGAVPLPATGSTRATSPKRWSPSCRRTARRSTAATSPSSTRASKRRAAPTTAATHLQAGFNSQGPVLLQTLNILENFDLQAMGHNSADYLHTVVEAMKLAYADRDTYYADPEFVDVPAKGLLSKTYAGERAAEIDAARASVAFHAGDPLPHDPDVDEWPYWVADIEDGEAVSDADGSFVPSAGGLKDTTHIAIIDGDGNVFDATPSGGWIRGAIILGGTASGSARAASSSGSTLSGPTRSVPAPARATR